VFRLRTRRKQRKADAPVDEVAVVDGDASVAVEAPVDAETTAEVVAALEAAPEPVEGARATANLSNLVVRGGAYLFGREAAGMVVRLVGVVVTVREIGPDQYGIYTAAAAYVAVLVTIAQMGAEIYLIRVREEPTKQMVSQTYTFLLSTSLLVTGLAYGGTYLFGSWIRPDGVLPALRVLLLCISINVLWAPAQGHIERRFAYKRMGILELGGDVALYATAIPLAILHFGAWSLVAGYFAWQTWLLFGSLWFSGLRPRLAWSWQTVHELAKHGVTYSSSSLLARLGGVVNPVVVGSFAGATGVGYVSFALRLVDTIGFAQRAAYRLGVVTMSKLVHEDKGRVRSALEDGSLLLLFGLALPFGGFALVARWVIPFVFGREWAAATSVYCFLVLAVVWNAGGILQQSLLFALAQNLRVTAATAIQTVALAVSAVLLVKWFGIEGFGIASVIALVDLIYLARTISKVTPFRQRGLIPFFIALAPPIFIPVVALPYCFALLAPALALFLVPPWRAEMFRMLRMVRTQYPRLTLRRRPAEVAPGVD
jgi:O-antigen/teichoic acid export membrane protein